VVDRGDERRSVGWRHRQQLIWDRGGWQENDRVSGGRSQEIPDYGE
jgi:hypothetical protein